MNTLSSEAITRLPWPHAPTHRLQERGTFFVTAGTYGKAHFFGSRDRLGLLNALLIRKANRFGWRLEAWAVFSNHYHFIAHSPESEDDATSLSSFLGQLHEVTARAVNRMDHVSGRRIWHNFWDTQLTHQTSYLARLNYVHQNAVKHGIVPVAGQYRWCSANWFEQTASAAMVKSIYRFKTDLVTVKDDFEVVGLEE